MKPAKREAAYQDLVDTPEHSVAEIVGGDLYVSPRPRARHSRAASILGMLLGPPYQLKLGGPGGWEILDEPELHLGAHVLVPDLAGWRYDLNPEFDLTVAHIEIAPQWVCEVLSPRTAALDRTRKLPIYAEHGVQHAWLIDPESRTLEVFRRQGERWLLIAAHEGTDPVAAEPFDATPIQISKMWLPVDR
ncbi:MAG: Uma2 family endonuclease [Myxococcota bacterium]